MNQKHLLRFIKSKLRKEPHTVCLRRDGEALTLAAVFESLGLTAYDLSIDTLDMHADWTTMHRFDKFNLKYSPIGQSRLREIFLKTNNDIGGRFLAEISREVFADLEANKYVQAEFRVSVYGTRRSEWGALAQWIVGHRLASPNVRWMIQLPRLYDAYRASGAVASFGDLLRNFFEPLFAVTLDPAADPALHALLTVVSGVDLVDDESKPEPSLGIPFADLPPPDSWTFATGPPYAYWAWYVSTNLGVLNKLRGERGLTQLSFRPHCGEAGDADHLAAAFLTAESINHGINLRKLPSLQYLYYLAQIGLAMSPLSNKCALPRALVGRGRRPPALPPPPPLQPPLPRLRQEPLPRLFQARAERVALDRRPADAAPHQGRACRGVRGGDAGLQAERGRHGRARAHVGAAVGLRVPL
jgi:AMP deaminase